VSLATAAALSSASAARADDGQFEQRPYYVDWPIGAPKGVLVYLHGICGEPPLKVEAEHVTQVAHFATKVGFTALFPTGLPDRGYLPPPQDKWFCWDHKNVAADIAYVSRLITAVEKEHKVRFPQRHLIGYSNGAYLVGGALQRALLKDYASVGMLSGGGIGTTPPPRGTGPAVFIEVGTSDKWTLSDCRNFVSIARTTLGDRLHVRELDCGHELSASRLEAFCTWFWSQASR
jgi:poly(3-hydroxybutyrate) depolymerase